MQLVTIVVPVYNTAPYLRKCLDSLVAQTHRPIEIIAVDDGSTDGSPPILAEYARANSDLFRVVSQENGGQASARNVGIAEAKGDWLCFIDSDDWIDPSFIEKTLNRALEVDAEIVDTEVMLAFPAEEGFSCRNTTDALPGLRKYWDGLTDGSTHEEPGWLIVHPAGSCHKLFSADLIRRSGVRFPAGMNFEDLATTPRLLSRARKISAVREPMYWYRQREGSSSKVVDSSWMDMRAVIDMLAADFAGDFRDELGFLALSRLLTGALVRALKSGASDQKVDEMIAYMDSSFPEWRKNPYAKRFLPRVNRLILVLVRIRAYGALRFLLMGKQQARGILRRGRAGKP